MTSRESSSTSPAKAAAAEQPASQRSATTAKAAPVQPALDAGFVDPKYYDWVEDENSNYLLRLTLPAGHKKEELRVHVDPAGRLSIRGRGGDGKADGPFWRLHKVFQLPPTSNLDRITGKLVGCELTITVPKLTKKDEDAKTTADHKVRQQQIESAKASLAAAPEKNLSGWKERVTGEGLKWVEAAGKKKEVIATAVAAFTLGVFVSHKFFSRN